MWHKRQGALLQQYGKILHNEQLPIHDYIPVATSTRLKSRRPVIKIAKSCSTRTSPSSRDGNHHETWWLICHAAPGKPPTESGPITVFVEIYYINGIKSRTHCVTAKGKIRLFNILSKTAKQRHTPMWCLISLRSHMRLLNGLKT